MACSCAQPRPLIYACSGAADVGAIADQAARQLSQRGYGKMSCLAGVGGRVPALMESTRSAPVVLAIHGCPQACAKSCLAEAGIKNPLHHQLADTGLEKGESPPSDEHVEVAAAKGLQLLGC